MPSPKKSHTARTIAYNRSLRAKYKNKRYKNRGTDFKEKPEGTIYEAHPEYDELPRKPGPCWCGEVYNHDWPGKEDGAPHPR